MTMEEQKNILVEIKNLTKIYAGREEPSVNNLSLRVYEGEIFGLLGPNGAGKTTTLSILCNLLKPTEGECWIGGYSVDNEMEQVKPLIGVVSQEIALYENLTAVENLHYFGGMYKLPKHVLKERIHSLLDRMGLAKYKNERVKRFSGGMKRRVNLLAGVLHNPKLLFLDEPTVGVDVQSRSVMIEYLRELNRDGVTLLYTSHMLDEAEKLCSRIAIIDEGNVLVKGTPQELIMQDERCRNLEDIFLQLTGRHIRE